MVNATEVRDAEPYDVTEYSLDLWVPGKHEGRDIEYVSIWPEDAIAIFVSPEKKDGRRSIDVIITAEKLVSLGFSARFQTSDSDAIIFSIDMDDFLPISGAREKWGLCNAP